MPTPLRTLIVEDSEDDTLLLVEELRRGGYEPKYTRVDSADRMETELAAHVWDIVFSDFTMPRFTAFDALAHLRKSGVDIPFIIVSGTIGEDRAVMAMKAGAHDYVLKDNMKRLVPAVERELREAANRRERKQAEETARYLAYNDPLTDLPNRFRFQEEMQRAIEMCLRENRRAVMLLMDLERFREVNDTLGHTQGDRLLRQVGLRLRTALPESDLVARLGGDEFGILLARAATVENISSVIKMVLDMLEAPVMIDGIPVAVEASIGVAIAPDHANDADRIMQRADIALYRAKQLGSGYAIYDPKYDSHTPQRLALAAELRGAIEREELTLHFQPQIDLRNGAIVAAEALVRWQHPIEGLLMPDRFIGVTEQTGLIRPLTQWVLAKSLQQCRTWCLDPQTRWSVCVNLSARSLHDMHLAEQIGRALRTAEVEAHSLVLEITESAIILEPQRARETLAALHRLGVGLSIDDFGTGYTSLAHIKHLPVNEIKIDKSFVQSLLKDPRDAAIVQSVIALAHHLGLTVVAEGVENAETLARLMQLGCDRAQGFHMSAPLSAQAILALPSNVDWRADARSRRPGALRPGAKESGPSSAPRSGG
jgi:diguanylate cyclase (GGDEF)-like protein